jgi:putative transposase
VLPLLRGALLTKMREAYRAAGADSARRQLQRLVAWLERNGHADAAASLREGLNETPTVLKLRLPRTLTRSLSTTNAIENLMSVPSRRRPAENDRLEKPAPARQKCSLRSD